MGMTVLAENRLVQIKCRKRNEKRDKVVQKITKHSGKNEGYFKGSYDILKAGIMQKMV